MDSVQATVYVVDDDDGARKSLRMLLEAEGFHVQAYRSGHAFLQAFRDHGASGCILLDMNLGDMTGLQLHAELKQLGCQTPIIYITGYGSIEYAVRAIQEGAVDFLTKPVRPDELLQKLHQVMQAPVSTQQAADAQNTPAPQQQQQIEDSLEFFSYLTPREREVLNRVLSGKTNKQIARELGISFRTVELHRSHILQKSGKNNMMELAQMAYATNGDASPLSLPKSKPAFAQWN